MASATPPTGPTSIPVPPNGICTLRAALNQADANAGLDAVEFSVAGTITPWNNLSASDAVVIDGYSAPGARPNTNPVWMQSNAVITVVLDGRLSAGGYITVNNDSTVRGLSSVNFTTGIRAEGHGNTIQGNFVGVYPNGDVAGNAYYGVPVQRRTLVHCDAVVYVATDDVAHPGVRATDVVEGRRVGDLVPCPTIRPSCFAVACGSCIENPRCAPDEACVATSGPLAGRCSCATLTPTPTEVRTVTPAPTDTPGSTATATATLPGTPAPTTRRTPSPGPTSIACVGDCDGDLLVTPEEVESVIAVIFDPEAFQDCPAFESGRVGAADLVATVRNAVGGCP